MKVLLTELTAAAAKAQDPSFVTASVPKLGGVDPLGLRQLNYDLMDQVLPHLNNVAKHVRPFVLIAWAWRRAHKLAQELGACDVRLNSQLQDFVDRIDVIFVWSQFLINTNADLPGRQFLSSLLSSREYTFGGPEWEKRREVRRFSTALSAPINYGPALKMLGWIHSHPVYPGVMMPTTVAKPALDAFEKRIENILGHMAFNEFGSVVVRRQDVETWANSWALDDISDVEADVMRNLLIGGAAPAGRQQGAELLLAAAAHAKVTDEVRLRAVMSGVPSNFIPPEHLLRIRDAWRAVQVRQLFRLALEAFLYWVILKLDGHPRTSDELVSMFLGEVPHAAFAETADEWLTAVMHSDVGVTEAITNIQEALERPTVPGLASAISAGLALCLKEVPQVNECPERADRLPLIRARTEASVRLGKPREEFVRHVLESWVLAQHAYWSVGRGLADARAEGKTLLRLRVILDEGGWTLTPGASAGSPPSPTPDRLQTMITLMRECRMMG